MPAFRLRLGAPALTSFCGIMDLKLGATLISLFAGLNKVAGAYGLLAVLLSGGAALSQPLGQLTMYAYSIASLAAFIWGLKKISEEDGPRVLIYAHLFALDHLLSTLWTAFFFVVWYQYVPHDGRRVANSEAQEAMMGGAQGGGMGEEERRAAARVVWEGERGFSATVIVVGWLIKVYFILILYSFALHLRRGTYSALPSSSTTPSSKFGPSSPLPPRHRALPGHTRIGSRGGPAYTHLRGNSLASTAGVGGGRGSIDGLDGTETTLAETLWEDEQGDEVDSTGAGAAAGERRASRSPLPAPLALAKAAGAGGAGAEVPPSPAFAKGTGMARQPSSTSVKVPSSGVPTGADEGGAGGAPGGAGGAGSNPFSAILGRMSGEVQR